MCRYFGQLSTAEYGNCYTFNSNISLSSDKDSGQRVATMTGPNSGERARRQCSDRRRATGRPERAGRLFAPTEAAV